MNTKNSRLDSQYKGRGYINLLRCSSLRQADTSPDSQKVINDAFAQSLGMIYVDDYYAEGVSGSKTFNRKDIQELLSRKHEQDDFDVIVVHDYSRLTRGGIRHGAVVEDELKKAGIDIICSTETIPAGPEGDLIKSIKHYSNQLQARSISLAVARGLGHALQQQRRPGASRTPYGLDRLYRDEHGTPTMLIRWDGLEQQWITPDIDGKPLKVVNRRRKLARSERVNHASGRKYRFVGYSKAKNETSELVVGAKDRVDTVMFIYRAYDIMGWGYDRIVGQLNRRNVPAPEGGRWTLRTVRGILRNPIYLGIEVRHRWTAALYHKLSEVGPIPVNVDQDKLAAEGRTSVPTRERPRDEWVLVDMPGLKDILPPDIRSVAENRLAELYVKNRKPHPKIGVPIHVGSEARHRLLNSPFLLSRLLREEKTGTPFRGETVKKTLAHGRIKHYRYYFNGRTFIYGSAALQQSVIRLIY